MARAQAMARPNSMPSNADLNEAISETNLKIEQIAESNTKALEVHRQETTKAIGEVDDKVKTINEKVETISLNQDILIKAFKLIPHEHSNNPKQQGKPIALMGQTELFTKIGFLVTGFVAFWKFVNYAWPHIVPLAVDLNHFIITGK